MATIVRSVSDVLVVTEALIVANNSTLPIYGTLDRADNYFASMLEGQKWAYTTRQRKLAALVSATKAIDRLNFVGDKADCDQYLQFPRGTDTIVPVDIEQASYELAIALLKGVDPNTERDNLTMTVQGYGNLRSEHDRSIVPPYIVAGIPSATAWNLLLPYLCERRGILIRRDS